MTREMCPVRNDSRNICNGVDAFTSGDKMFTSTLYFTPTGSIIHRLGYSLNPVTNISDPRGEKMGYMQASFISLYTSPNSKDYQFIYYKLYVVVPFKPTVLSKLSVFLHSDKITQEVI